jgi:hypothetical protein
MRAFLQGRAADEHVWHKCRAPLLPKRDIDGKWLEDLGQIWRRRREDGKWEYRQDPETRDHWEARAL